MSVYLYSGTPGSGKSLHVANKIIWAIRTHKFVICNFELNRDKLPKGHEKYLTVMQNWEITPQKLVEYSLAKGRLAEDSILLIIDEAQLMFNAREWNAKGRSDWLSFFTQHRKYGYTIILVAQFDRMLDRYIRGVIEYEYVHRKLSNFGLKGWFLQLLMFSHKMFVSVEIWYPLKEKIGSDFFRFHKRNARIYDTFNTFVAPNETGGKGGPVEVAAANVEGVSS